MSGYIFDTVFDTFFIAIFFNAKLDKESKPNSRNNYPDKNRIAKTTTRIKTE